MDLEKKYINDYRKMSALSTIRFNELNKKLGLPASKTFVLDDIELVNQQINENEEMDLDYKNYYVDKKGTEYYVLHKFIEIELMKLDLSVNEFCNIIDISYPAYQKIKTKKPTPYIYERIESFFGKMNGLIRKFPITKEEMKYLKQFDKIY